MRCTAQHGDVTVGQPEQKSAEQQAKLAVPVPAAWVWIAVLQTATLDLATHPNLLSKAKRWQRANFPSLILNLTDGESAGFGASQTTDGVGNGRVHAGISAVLCDRVELRGDKNQQ